MIQYENEIIEYLNVPSVPKRAWDGRSSFKNGVAVTTLRGGGEAYAVCTYDADKDAKPRIKRCFGFEQFDGIRAIYVVPSYMDEDVDAFDLDERSKKAAEQILREAHDLEMDGVKKPKTEMPKNEYCFDFIEDDEQGIAYIKSYNAANKIKGHIPDTHTGIVARLAAIWHDEQVASDKSRRKNKRNKR